MLSARLGCHWLFRDIQGRATPAAGASGAGTSLTVSTSVACLVIVVICTYRVTNSNNSNQLSLRRGDQRSGANLSLKKGNLIDPTGSRHLYINCVWLSRGSLAERGLLGYNHSPSQLQEGGSVRLNQLSRLDVVAPYLKLQGQGQGREGLTCEFLISEGIRF